VVTNAPQVAHPPKLSVTLVTFNHGAWLERCLESIINQETNFAFEVLVGDDASTDNVTTEIVRRYARDYPGIVVPIIREKNVGGSENLLDLVRRTRGEYIAHIDGDDCMLPGKLQTQVTFLDNHPECSVVAHEMRVINDTGEQISEKFLTQVKPTIADINYLVLTGCYFAHSSKMYRRSAVLSWERDRRTIDYFYHIEHASQGKIGYIQQVLGEYRRHGRSASAPCGTMIQSVEQCIQQAFNRAIELGVRRSVVHRGRLRHRYYGAFAKLLAGDDEEFSSLIFLRFREFPRATSRHLFAHVFRHNLALIRRLIHFF